MLQSVTKVKIHETRRVGILLAFVGGFLDVNTYLLRGGVFANAQTGNMVLLMLQISEGQWMKALYYIIPIIAFFSGVVVTELVKLHERWHEYNQMLNTMMLYPPKLFLIFAVGLKDPSEEYIQIIKKQNNIEDDEVFYFPGKLDYQHLTLLDKFLMRGLKAQIKKHQSLTDEEQRILNSFNHLVDETNRQFILPLIHYVQKNALL